MTKAYKDTTSVFVPTDKDTIPYDKTSKAVLPYYEQRFKSAFEEIEKTSNVVLKFLKEHKAPKEVLEAFDKLKPRSVTLI